MSRLPPDSASIPYVGRQVAGLNARLDLLEQAQSTGTTTTVTLPVVDTTFTPLYDRSDKRGPYVTLQFAGFGAAYDLKIILLERALAVDETAWNEKRLPAHPADELTDAARQAGTFATRLDQRLKYGTQYDVVRLVAIGQDTNDRIANPDDGPAGPATFAGYPGNVLYTFTTPERFGAPSAPDASLILKNERDLLTADQHDAHVELLQFAPLADDGSAQSYTVAGVIQVRSVLERTYPSGEVLQEDIGPHTLTDAELTQVADGLAGRPLSTPPNRGFVVLNETNLKAGATYAWVANIVYTLEGKNKATGNVAINAGNQQGDLSQLTNVSLTVVATDPYDSKHVQPLLRFTQPVIPVGLRNFTIKLKKNADTAWKAVGPARQNVIQSDAYNQTTNAGTITGTTGSATITGVGTQFKRLEAGWEIKVGAQTLTISDTPTSDTSLTVTANPSASFSASAYTIVYVVAAEAAVKVKPSTSYNLQCPIRARSSDDTPLVVSASFTTDADGNVIQDTTAPTDLAVPVIDWTAAGRLRIRNMNFGTDTVLQSQTASLKKKFLVIYDGASTYLDIVNRTTAANEAAARFEFGLKSHIILSDIKKKIYKNVFGSGGSFRAYWYAQNDINVSVASGVSNTLNVTDINEVMSDSYDAIRQLDVATGLRSPGNVLGNGAWKFVDLATDQQQNWARWDGLTTPLPAIGGTGYKSVTSTSNEIAYVASTHSGWLKANSTWMLLQNIKDRYDPGESHGIYILMRAGASVTVTAKLHLFNLTRANLTGTANSTSSTAVVGTGTTFTTEVAAGDYIVISSQRRRVTLVTDNTHLTVDTAFSSASGAIGLIIDNIDDPISQSVSLTTSNQVFGARIKMKDSPNLASTPGGTDYASHQFGLEITSNTQDAYYYNFMDTRGSDIMAYAPRGSEGDVAGLNPLQPTFVAAPDILTAGIIGSLGGWKDLNSGGLISPV